MGDDQFFKEAEAGSLTTPDYDYSSQIKNPKDLGMSASGSISALERDFKGLAAYIKVLLGGGGPAQKGPGGEYRPLGNKYFLQTGAKCKDRDTQKDVNRSIYINNVPTGALSLSVDDEMGTGGGAKGLVPGILEKMATLNPMDMFQAFTASSDPSCVWVTMETIDESNMKTYKGAYLTETDLRKMNPCWFKEENGQRKNPVTGRICTIRDGFTTEKKSIADMPDDTLIKIYYTSIGLLLLYMFTKILMKKN